jgi:hypothetical protein
MAAVAFGGRVILSSLLANFAVCASQGRNSGSTDAKPMPNRCGGTRDGLQRPLRPLAAVFPVLCDDDSKN